MQERHLLPSEQLAEPSFDTQREPSGCTIRCPRCVAPRTRCCTVHFRLYHPAFVVHGPAPPNCIRARSPEVVAMTLTRRLARLAEQTDRLMGWYRLPKPLGL